MFLKRSIQFFLALFRFKLVRIKPKQPSRYEVNLNIMMDGLGLIRISDCI